MKVFLFQALIVHIVFNVYVFIRGWQVLPKSKSYRVPYALLFIIELVSYFIGLIFNVALPTLILKPILLVGTSWMLFIGYTAALLLIYDFIKFLGRWVNSIRRLNLQRIALKRVYIVISVVIVASSMTYGSYRFWHPVVTEMNLNIDKKVEGLKTLKVVMVADVHAGHLIDKKVLRMYVDKIMEQKADVILLVGDIIDYDLPPLVDQKMDEEFRRLQAPYGVYVTTGNHEYRLNSDEKIAWLASKTGMTMLRDTSINIADKFYIVGREDDHAEHRKSLPDLMKSVDRKMPVIVMNHEPKSLSEESSEHVDLAVYGHTHNGQLFPYNLLMSLIYEVGHGYKKKDNTHVYVTSGLGLAGPQYRIGTISEIVVLNLQFN